MWLGPPKRKAAALRIDLPPFLTEFLTDVWTFMSMSRCSAGPAEPGCDVELRSPPVAAVL